MEYFKLPEGWKVYSSQHELDGDLTINLTYEDHCTYTVWWDKFNSVTMTGLCSHGKYLAFDPTVVMLAMYYCVHYKLAPLRDQRDPRDT